tara:strand:+ start:269 stop:598 length:330 start_codon:yes stop_codon:yes gene_type:complete
MANESLKKEERLFLYLVSTFKTSAIVALGEMENPMTNKKDLNLEQASYYIDLLDMLQSKASGNMSEYEEQMLINTVSELRMELIRKKPALDFVKKAGEDTSSSSFEREQ